MPKLLRVLTHNTGRCTFPDGFEQLGACSTSPGWVCTVSVFRKLGILRREDCCLAVDRPRAFPLPLNLSCADAALDKSNEADSPKPS